MNPDDLSRLLHESVGSVVPAAPDLGPLRAEGRRRLVRRRVSAVAGAAALTVVAVAGLSLASTGSGKDSLVVPITPTPSAGAVDTPQPTATPEPTVSATQPPRIEVTSTSTVTPGPVRELGLFLDDWYRHSEDLKVDTGGTGLWTFRNYEQCAPGDTTACSDQANGAFHIYPAEVRFIVTSTSTDGRSALARITSTNDPEQVDLGPMTMTVTDTGGLELETAGKGSRPMQTFCGASTTDTTLCGA
jgi:hypothetical protein